MTDEELRELQELHHQLKELTDHQGWEVLVDYVLHGHGGSVSRQHRLVNGGAKTHEDYIRETGWLAGAHHVLDARKAVGKMLDSEMKDRIERAAYASEEAADEPGEAS